MGVTILYDDICKVDTQYIAYQCDCISKKPSGIAQQICFAFPWANIYRERVGVSPLKIQDLPTDQQPAQVHVRGDGRDKRYVIAMLAQVYPGRPRFSRDIDTRFQRELYFLQCLRALFIFDDLTDVAFPWHIGCGTQGGNWQKYEVYIRTYANMYPKVNVYLVR
jgi:hypothetical protein